MGGCGRRSDRIGGWSRARPAAVRVSLHGSPASVITHCCGLGLGVGVLGWFRAGVDGLCRLCCDDVSSIDMYNNDVGQKSAQKIMKQTGDLKAATLYFAS